MSGEQVASRPGKQGFLTPDAGLRPEQLPAVKSPVSLTTDLDDPGLSARIRARDPTAFQAVVHAYLPQIVRAARATGLTRDEAEDVAQDTFITFLETAPRFEGRSHVRTWLFGILYRKIASNRRHLDRDRHTDDIDEVIESRFNTAGSWSRPPRSADAAFHSREIREQIKACLDTFPTQHRMAFVLREVEELSTQEICKILDVTVTNLGVMLYRVRNRLRSCLETHGLSRPK